MNFLAVLLADVVKWLLTKLGSYLLTVWQRIARKNEIEKEAGESVKPLKDAQTGDEVDKATDSALDKF